ncbi:MAG: hypothetical protein ACERLG_04650 [Sedimentibacter sp.]
MKMPDNPLNSDPKIVSGAVCVGLLAIILQENYLKDVVEKLNINKNSKILVISTEGDTYPDNYRKIILE